MLARAVNRRIGHENLAQQLWSTPGAKPGLPLRACGTNDVQKDSGKRFR